ncbi:uncharacterized protein LOC127840885 isoform X16 [Dreissena polymorpha]|uniref:uncharacterized protein LOC127840885 isoform X6 n=1 Tax=Dreissena polymorpha TaxID=45954 RepID=UPI0022645E39|nr:uncharacterized protein LOC127840885 isoform X6 [Dreissena polymorpha]XP_052225287.1 uncharacterized protein LOC127840885 isoform X7 [Dreissena polymorpha]XP_052225288.1 uncharacterized protein LOC127840885 isoform X8 [Dreissena polymorpha]XP_052225290.1 uncharacterized protein LOC127840885 isoform X9 [Dreissena polymorpha]XP_052225291.1 uncharacterized protein LOC127840885 isoform X10 [Dreissena polymorpha]XP_052225292.1 uncharacterized protein LOC127840885 isoform X11 [Dreissena polymorph
MGDTVYDAVQVSRLLSLNAGDDYSKYESVKLAAKKRKEASESNKPKSKKILVTPLRAFPHPEIVAKSDQQPSAIHVRSSHKYSDIKKREFIDSRRCKSETKDFHLNQRLEYKSNGLERHNVLGKDIHAEQRFSITSNKSPSAESENHRRREVAGEKKSKPRVLIKRELTNVEKSERKTHFASDISNGQVHASEKPEKTSRKDRESPNIRRSESTEKYKRSSPSATKNHKVISTQKQELTYLVHRQRSSSVADDVVERKDSTHEIKQDKPLMEVRRRLDFEKEEIEDDVGPLAQELDFTDKLAALRSIISKGRDLKDITDRKALDFKDISDRKAYYDEYRTRRKRVMVSRSDSLKENHDTEAEFLETSKLGRNSEYGKDQRRRKVQSADIFSTNEVTGRITREDLQILKERLSERNKHVENNGVSKELQESNLELLHAGSGRKIITSSGKGEIKAELDMDNNVERPDSRLESKETQTNELNQSVRSVQSNAPFYEPSGRPMSAPLFNCQVSVGKTKVYKTRTYRLEGIEKGVNVESMGTFDHKDEKQTNVGSFVGSSLTPEKDKAKMKLKVKAQGKEYKDMDDGKLNTEDVRSLKHEPGNQRPCSRNSQLADDEINHINKKTVRSGTPRTSRRSSSSLNYQDTKGYEVREDKNISKSERKVREWIRKQEMLRKGRPVSAVGNFTPGPLLLEELNVSISIPAGQNCADIRHSPSDSCDRIPVKLEKSKNEKAYTLGQSSEPIGFLVSKTGNVDGLSSRQSIFDRLERITMAVTTKQHQFEVDIPVADGVIMGQKSGVEKKLPKQTVEQSDSADTETATAIKKPRSSVFSLPFSIQSGESISSTVQAVKLLRKLYNVDTETRQNLVLMAKCFRRWFNNVLHARVRNLQILQAARQLSPVSYGVMLRESDTCYRDTLLSRYFAWWKTACRNARLERKVRELHRRHTLQKGMNAFKWAINRSKLQHGILQDRINSMLLSAYFEKWRVRTEENRRLRLQQAFLRWRQFTKEAQKLPDIPITPIQRIRMLRTQTNTKLKGRMLLEWYNNYRGRVKQHKADKHHRMIVLSQGFKAWRSYTATSKEKKARVLQAEELFRVTLQRKMFTCLKVEFSKYSIARAFHRVTQLKVAMLAWRQGSEISKSEHENDLRVAEVYWSHSTLRRYFTAWRDTLLTNWACNMCNKNLLRNAFTEWRQRHTEVIQRRSEADTFRSQRVMSRTFKHWCMFVGEMKRRRAQAVARIQGVLLGHVFMTWRWYTDYQKQMRKQMVLHVRCHSLNTMRRCLDIWRANFRVKCDKKKALQLWSNTCARRAGEVWRLVCHKRRLARLLIDTEPLRQLQTQRVFFAQWRSRFSLILEEKQDASEVRALLDLSQLRRRFIAWRHMTTQQLRIKPMLQCYRTRLITECFVAWRDHVVNKAECLRSEKAVITVRLRNGFNAWRRQYQVHQTEKAIRLSEHQRQLRRCFVAWHAVIQRKHGACDFHSRHLVRRTFSHWRTSALRRVRQKQLQLMEQETVMSLLRQYFTTWRQATLHQQSHDLEVTTHLEQKQTTNRVKVAFNFWRRHFRATLVARENEKIRVRCLAKQALEAWHLHTQNALQEAVERFAAAIGLTDSVSFEQELDMAGEDTDDNQGEVLPERDDLYDNDLAMTPRSVLGSRPMTPRTPRTPKTPITPKNSTFISTPRKRIGTPSLSRLSLAQSLELEAGPIMNASFLDARFEMEHAVKTESRREIVVTVVHRLRHWPVSVVFDQWREFTSRQREFKNLTTQMISIHQELAVKQHYSAWLKQFQAMKMAKQHHDHIIQHKALLSLVWYRDSRKQKKQRNQQALAHFAQKTFKLIFPQWLAKAQESHQAHKILHLWTTITEEERALIPRERSFRYKQNRKVLQQCYQTWYTEYRKISTLKNLYHKILLERYFAAWSSWAWERRAREDKGAQFRNIRIQKLVFKMWCLRYTQRTEVERRYTETWHNYMGIIFQSWATWARDHHHHKMVSAHLIAKRQRATVRKMFHTWKSEHKKLARVNRWHDNRLVVRVLYSWHCVAIWQRDMREKQLQCQLVSCTALAKRVFTQWQSRYRDRLALHAAHRRTVEKRVLRIVTHWRHLAQATRGRQLRKHFQLQKVRLLFTKWTQAHCRNQERYQQLNEYVGRKQLMLLGNCLETWRSQLMCLQAERVFNMRLVTTLLQNWKLAAQGCRVRRESLVAYQSRKSFHIQQAYFLYWFNVAKARKSIRGHANLKIQLNVFKSWLLYTRKKNNLRRLEKTFTRKRNERILSDHWYLVKTRYDYCVELGEMAGRVIHEKNMLLMRQALSHWDFRLKIVIADEYHEHALAKRTATRWRQFVARRRQEREHTARQTERALRFYNKQLCNKAYQSWYNEVLATRHAKRRRQKLCNKYALVWKHKVDMVFTAKCLYNEKLLSEAWRRWHLEFVRYKAIRKVEAFDKKTANDHGICVMEEPLQEASDTQDIFDPTAGISRIQHARSRD